MSSRPWWKKPTVSLVKNYALCTCCIEPRRAAFPPNMKGFHLDDSTFATVEHIHVDKASLDSDGRHGEYWTIQPWTSDVADWWERQVRSLVGTWHGNGTLEVRGEGTSAHWHANTEEGYTSRSLRRCDQTYCSYDDHSVYDQYAIAAGY